MSGKGAKGLAGKGAKGTMVKGDKKKPVTRSARAGLQVSMICVCLTFFLVSSSCCCLRRSGEQLEDRHLHLLCFLVFYSAA